MANMDVRTAQRRRDQERTPKRRAPQRERRHTADLAPPQQGTPEPGGGPGDKQRSDQPARRASQRTERRWLHHAPQHRERHPGAEGRQEVSHHGAPT